MKDLIKEWNEVTLMKLFEIPVTDLRDNTKAWIIFDIELNEKNKTFEASHESLSQEQKDSEYIAFVEIELDGDWHLENHLEDLYDACDHAIMDSTWFELREED